MSAVRARIVALFAAVALVATGMLAVATTSATAATTAHTTSVSAKVAKKHVPKYFKNCKKLNKRWKHGIGKKHARDHTSGKPVRNFKRSTKLYKKAMKANKRLDRDKDGIACEKR